MSHVVDMPLPDSYWEQMLRDMCQLTGIWKEMDELLKKDKAAEEAEAKAAEEAEAKADAEAQARKTRRFHVVDV